MGHTGTRRSATDRGRSGRWSRRWTVVAGVITLIAAALTAPALAQEPEAQVAESGLRGVAAAIDRDAPDRGGAELAANPELAKITNELLLARANGEAALADGGLSSAVQLRGGAVEVEVSFSNLTPAVEAAVAAIGFDTSGAFPQFDLMTGSVDLDLLDELAAIDQVVNVRANYGATTAAGAVDNQANNSIGVAAARSQVGVDGSGVEIGVMSDSFNDLSVGSTSGANCARSTSGTSSQTSADLPASVGNLAPAPAPGLSDEGRAMMELIHDLAPGADLTFRTAFISEADFAVGIGDLVDCGADVVVDDIIYFAEPMFQDGLVAQAAQQAFDDGVPYFSSAGNFYRYGIDQGFRDSDPADDVTFGDDFHDFDPGPAVNNLIPLTIPAFESPRIFLQWNQPFLTGGIGPGAAVDLDLIICTDPTCPAGGTFVFGNAQGCSPAARAGDPIEGVSFNPAAADTTWWIGVDHVCGSQADTRFRAVLVGVDDSYGYGVTTSGAPVFNAAQTWGHSAAAGAMSVAAIDYFEIDSGGALYPGPELNVEPFSSLGGDLPFYFDGDGNPLPGAPVTRFKPDITAPDGINNTFFGTDVEPDGFPNFFGTSAAAPNAAAVAALMLDAQPNLRPDQVYDRLKDTALDMETPGVDPLAGYGLVQALGAVPPVYDLTLLSSPCPIYDSASASGGLSGPIPANTTRTVTVSGTLPGDQGVPAGTCVPTGATGVLYTISAIGPQGAGNLRLSESGVVANGGVVNYVSNGMNNANTVAVPLGGSGDVDIFANNAATGVRLVALGYYSVAGDLTYNDVTPCAFADSRPTQGPSGGFVGPFAPGAAYPDVDVTGTFPAAQGGGNTNCGIPNGADAIVANLVAVGSSGGSGVLSAATGGTNPSEPVTYFADLPVNNATTVVVPLSPSGTIAVDIDGLTGSPTSHIRLVALGYLSDEAGDDYNELDACAAFDTRSGQGASGPFLGERTSGSGGVTTYQITGSGIANQGGNNGGTCGVPDGASAVLINLVAIDPSQVGNFRAYATGSSPTGGVLNFAPLNPAMNNSNAVVVPLSATGEMDLFVNTGPNDGTATTNARGVILGFYR